jgi:hypothetical protein
MCGIHGVELNVAGIEGLGIERTTCYLSSIQLAMASESLKFLGPTLDFVTDTPNYHQKNLKSSSQMKFIMC